jgi:hypothetical protein
MYHSRIFFRRLRNTADYFQPSRPVSWQTFQCGNFHNIMYFIRKSVTRKQMLIAEVKKCLCLKWNYRLTFNISCHHKRNLELNRRISNVGDGFSETLKNKNRESRITLYSAWFSPTFCHKHCKLHTLKSWRILKELSDTNLRISSVLN